MSSLRSHSEIWSLCVILKVLMMQADCNADINEKVLFITHVYTVIEQKKVS